MRLIYDRMTHLLSPNLYVNLTARTPEQSFLSVTPDKQVVICFIRFLRSQNGK